MIENYYKHSNGVIEQIEKNPFDYNFEYSNNYNKLGEIGTRMAYLRLGHLIGSIGHIPDSVMDVGYGNGDFLKACSNIIPNCFASDVSDYPCPEGCNLITDPSSINVEVATFYDVLEHFTNIYDIKNIRANYLVISLPECHYFNDDWFENWKHRKPNEHLWHFNSESLCNFMKEIGYDVINLSNIEDTIRKNNLNYTNILTGVFKKL
jgi:hypothetical protein